MTPHGATDAGDTTISALVVIGYGSQLVSSCLRVMEQLQIQNVNISEMICMSKAVVDIFQYQQPILHPRQDVAD